MEDHSQDLMCTSFPFVVWLCRILDTAIITQATLGMQYKAKQGIPNRRPITFYPPLYEE
jgi:hypothetical protein